MKDPHNQRESAYRDFYRPNRLFTKLGMLLLFWYAAAGVQAQPQISFMKQLHDFGEIDPDGGVQSHRFEFVNVGDEALRLLDVKASCGCTTPGYTREPIAPGDTGALMVAFNPKDQRSGFFSKNVTLKTNDPRQEKTIVAIQGIIQRRISPLEERFPYEHHGLRLAKTMVRIDPAYTDTMHQVEVAMYNSNDRPVSLDRLDAPPFIKARFDPVLLPPKEYATLRISLLGNMVDDEGLKMEQVDIYTEGHEELLRFTVLAKFKNRGMNYHQAQSVGAPRVKFRDLKHDFGEKKGGFELRHRFVFSNTGQQNLIIRKTDAECGCTITEVADELVPPGARSYIDVTLDTREQYGQLKKTITVYTNDPTQPEVKLEIQAQVN